MLYLIAQWMDFEGGFNLIRYLSFRSGAAILTALIIGMIIGPRFINLLRVRQGKGQPIREDGPQSHLAKRGTPTMGGLMILISIAISLLLWMDLSSLFIWACIIVTLGFGLIGFLDDFDKVRKASHKGVSGKMRLLAEFVVAGFASWLILSETGTQFYVPFFSHISFDLGILYYFFAAFVIVGAGNAVNLTDGLDGLATMPVVIASMTFLLIVYLVGNVVFPDIWAFPMWRVLANWRFFAARLLAHVWPFYGLTHRLLPYLWAIPVLWLWAAHWALLPCHRTMKLFWR